METRGSHIVIDGPPGVGKTTIINEIARRLKTGGNTVLLIEASAGSIEPLAAIIRQLAAHPPFPIANRAKLLLECAASNQALQRVNDSLNSGVYLLSDESLLTTLIRQFYGYGGIDYYRLNRVLELASGGFQPNKTIILDANTATLKQRLQNRADAKQDEDFLERVRTGYLWEAKQRGYPVVLANNEVSETVDKIWRLIKPDFKRSLDHPDSRITKNSDMKASKARSKELTYYIPKVFDDKTAKIYKRYLDLILVNYHKICQKMPSDGSTDFLAEQVLPLAAQINREDEWRESCKRFRANKLHSLTGNGLNDTGEQPNLALIDFWPKNEISLLPELLFMNTNLSVAALATVIDGWSYQKKASVLKSAIGKDMTSTAIYTYELVASYQQMSRMEKITGLSFAAQTPSPRYGFEVPAAIESYVLSDLYESCFDKSLELYSKLQSAGYQDAAWLATLAGHKLRFICALEARSLEDLIQRGDPALTELVEKLISAAGEIHPNIGEVLTDLKKLDRRTTDE